MLKISQKYLKSFFLLASLTMKPAAGFSTLNDGLIDKLVSDKTVKSGIVESVMRMIDRGDFTAGSCGYYDSPSGIGYAATISAPHMHAWALVNFNLFQQILNYSSFYEL